MIFRPLIAIAAVLIVATSARAQSSTGPAIDGFAVGAEIKGALLTHAAPAASGKLGAFDGYRWARADGTTTSVTASPDSGKIVFVESDWNGDPAAAKTDFPGLTFGATTLAAIRATFGSKGFSFKKHALHMDARDIISVNAYHLVGAKSTVLVLVTTQPVADVPEVGGKPQIDPGKGTLQAVTLADIDYLDGLWGKEKVSDPQEKPVAVK
jgi:hypothetical protein